MKKKSPAKKIDQYFKPKNSPKKQEKSEEQDKIIDENIQQDEEEKQQNTDSMNDFKLPEGSGLVPFDEFANQLCSWKKKLTPFVSSKQWKAIYDFIKPEYASKTIFPPANLIFNAFRLTPINNLKVIVVGQDPYFNPSQAMGLSFSVPKGVTPPPSLKNIYKCIENDKDIKNFKAPKHGDLTKWATQGVFMLNDLLTVESGKPASHNKSGWKKFTDEVIKIINDECDQIVFMLWGLPSQNKAKIVDSTRHYVLKSSHPSPMSASKGFLTCQHFSLANAYLKKVGKEEINWNLD